MKSEDLLHKVRRMFVFVFFITLSFGQLGRISFAQQQINVYLYEIVMACIILINIKNITLHREHRSLAVSAVFLILVLSASLVNHVSQFTLVENAIGALYLCRLGLYVLFFFSLIKLQRGTVQKGIAIFIILTIVFSFGQYALYPNLRNLDYLGWDPHHYRVFGTFFDTTTAGVMLVMTFIYAYAHKNELLARFGKAIVYLILAGVFVLILLTYSRIAYIGFISGLTYLLFHNNKRFLSIVVVVFIVSIPLLPRPFGEGVRLERMFSIASRVRDYHEGITLSKKQPLLGVGYNRLGFVRPLEASATPSHARFAYSSSYLTILATSGIIGLFAFLYFFKSLFDSVDRTGRSVMIVPMVASFFDNVLLVNFVLVLLLCVIAVHLRSRGNNGG